ncbi:MAG: hypothetical protein GY851_22235 [bacterium]|nr:hypothetical protein [bacterium]
MNELTVLLLLLAVVVAVPLAVVIVESRHLRKYWSRPCTGREWRRRFPHVPKQDIRSFLQAFCDAFAFKSKHRCKFSPTDKVMDVYRAVYPPRTSVGDCFELETLAFRLENDYGVDLENNWDSENTTLGDLFEMTRTPDSSQ